MGRLRGTASGEVTITTLSKESWESKVDRIKQDSLRMQNEFNEANESNFVVRIIAPKEVQPSSQVEMVSAVIEKDWKIAKRIEMVDIARDLITAARSIDMNDPALPIALAASIEGKGLFEYNIGEFFLLYGRFEGTVKSNNLISEMERLVGDDDGLKRPIRDRGGVKSRPLPYVVRQTLAHFGGGNPDWSTVKREDVTQSIDLLKSWLREVTTD